MVLEYLLALADRNKDEFFEKKELTESDRRYYQGKLEMIDEIVGLGSFLKHYKTQEEVMKELLEKQRKEGGD